MKELFDILPQIGRVEWIGIRPARQVPMESLQSVTVLPQGRLAGDRYSGGTKGKRQITLIQAEHLETVASLLGKEVVPPDLVRRNIVVRGINLLALHNRQFRIGSVILEGTGYCHPCSRMETNLGPGGYNAMRGHGGILARVVQEGVISVGDAVEIVI